MTYKDIARYAGEISPAVSEVFDVVRPDGLTSGDPNYVEATVNEAYNVLAVVYPEFVGTDNFNRAAVLYGYHGIHRVSIDECKALGWSIPTVIPDDVKKMLKGV